MSLDTVNCTTKYREYCLDYLARGAMTVTTMCGPCLARIIPPLDLAAGRDLPWPQYLRDRAGVPAPAELEPIRNAGIQEVSS